jgi:hypothetical protein
LDALSSLLEESSEKLIYALLIIEISGLFQKSLLLSL